MGLWKRVCDQCFLQKKEDHWSLPEPKIVCGIDFSNGPATYKYRLGFVEWGECLFTEDELSKRRDHHSEQRALRGPERGCTSTGGGGSTIGVGSCGLDGYDCDCD